MKLSFTSLAVVTALLAAASAQAHVRLKYPTPRYAEVPGDADAQLKFGPCGVTGDSRTSDTSRISVFEPGETITVQFTETINHSGFFRISFDDDGQDSFQFPTSPADIESTPVLPVLVDNIADHQAGDYTQQLTLPNMECENCTLQLIQVMTDGNNTGPWTADDIYFQCADIVLRAGGSGSGGTGGGGGSSTGGGGSGGASGSAGASSGGSGGNVGTGGTGTSGAGSGGTAGSSSSAGSAGRATTTTSDTSDESGCAVSGSRGGARSAALLLGALGLVSSRRWYRSARRSARSRG